jgi:hypothetical protein
VQVVRGGPLVDPLTVHDRGVGQVGGGQATGVGGPEQETLAPALGRLVVAGPGQAGRDGLDVDAHLLQLGVTEPAAGRAVGRPVTAERVVVGAQPVRVGGLAHGDLLHVAPGLCVQVGPEQPRGEHEVQLEGGIPEQLPAPLGAPGEPVGGGEALDRGDGLGLQRAGVDVRQPGVVVVQAEQDGVAQDRGEAEVRRSVRADAGVPLLLDPPGVHVQQLTVDIGDRIRRGCRCGRRQAQGTTDAADTRQRQEPATGQCEQGTSTAEQDALDSLRVRPKDCQITVRPRGLSMRTEHPACPTGAA